MAGSPGRSAAPTLVQCLPSAEEYPVSVSPARVSRSHRGDAADTWPAGPAMSWVKSYCIRTPWPGVTMIAAYGDPGVVPALTRIPALAQGWVRGACGKLLCLRNDGPLPLSDVIRTVRLPFPARGWWTK